MTEPTAFLDCPKTDQTRWPPDRSVWSATVTKPAMLKLTGQTVVQTGNGAAKLITHILACMDRIACIYIQEMT
jgi:hypothetical protein